MEKIGVESVFITKEFDKGIKDYNDSLKKAQTNTDAFAKDSAAGYKKTEDAQEKMAAQTVRSTEQMGKLKNMLGNMATAAAAAAVYKTIQWLKDASSEAAQAELVIAKLNNVLRSTGGVAGVTADDIMSMSTEMANLSGVEDDVITNGAALMLTFTKIGKETFPQAMQAAMDLSAMFGQDLQTSVIQVGKALNDPSGMAAMKRIGVSFSQAQIDMAKELFKTGKMAEYQALILSELTTEVGGASAAMGDTFAGSMNKLKVATGEVSEEFGYFINQLLKPGVLETIKYANALAESIRVEREIDLAQKQGIITMTEANNLINEMTWTSLTAAEAETKLAERVGNVSDEVRKSLVPYKTYNQNLIDAKMASGELTKKEQDLFTMYRSGKVSVTAMAIALGGLTETEYAARYEAIKHAADLAAEMNLYKQMPPWVKGYGAALADAADDADLLAQKEKAAAEAEKIWRAEQDLLKGSLSELSALIGGKLGPNLDDFKEKQAGLYSEAEKLRAKISELEAKKYLTDAQKEALAENKTKLEEIGAQITKNADEHEIATKRILLDLLMQRAAMDGLTTDEVAFITTIAETWGLIDPATKAATIAADQALTDLAAGKGLAETISKFETANGLVGGISSKLNGMNGKTFTTTLSINVRESGGGVNIQGGQFTTTGRGGNYTGREPEDSEWARGANFTIPPGYQENYPIGYGSSGEQVIVLPKATANKTSVTYSPAMAAQPVANSYSNAATVNMGGVNIYNGMGEGELAAAIRRVMRSEMAGV